MFAVFAYLLHLTFFLVQIALIIYLVLTGALDLFGLEPEEEIFLTLGLTVSNRLKRNQFDGAIRLALGCLLGLPWLLKTSFIFSGVGAILTLIYLIYWERVHFDGLMMRGVAARVLMTILAGITIFSVFFEGDDTIVLGQRLFKKAYHYQQLEASWHDYYEVTAPNIGDKAPDFELLTPDSDELIRLSDFRNQRPVLLLFGAHT